MFFIFIGLLSGYFLSRVTLKSRSLSVAFAPVLGTIVLVALGYGEHYKLPENGWLYGGILAVLAGMIAVVEYADKGVRRSSKRTHMEIWEDVLCVVLGAVLLAPGLINHFCADAPTHAHIIQQIIREQWPIRGLFTDGVPLVYHYGYDGVVAMLASGLHVEYVYVVQAMMMLSVCGILYALCRLLRMRGVRFKTRVFGLFFLFGFSGLSAFYYNAATYSMVQLMLGPSGLFIIGITTWCLSYMEYRNRTLGWTDSGVLVAVLVALGLFAPLYSSVCMALFLLIFLFGALESVLGKRWGQVAVWAAGFAVLWFFWQTTKLGMLQVSNYYEKMVVMWSFQVFDSWREVWLYVRGNSLLFVFWLGIVLAVYLPLIKHPKRFLEAATLDRFLYIGAGMVCVPFIWVFPYINPLDNFIKIPYIGMVCCFVLLMLRYDGMKKIWKGALFVITVASMYRISLTHNTDQAVIDHWLMGYGVPYQAAFIAKMLLVAAIVGAIYWVCERVKDRNVYAWLIVVAFLVNGTVFYGDVVRKWNDLRGHYTQVHCFHPNLIRWCEGHLSNRDMVFIPREVNPDFLRYYRRHCASMYAPKCLTKRFEEVSAVAGIPLLNNVNFSYAVLPELERPIWEKFHSWYVDGRHRDVAEFHANYLIFDRDEQPEYVADLIQNGEICLAKEDIKENWIVYFIHKPMTKE